MTRTLNDHVITEADAVLKITVEDAPGAGGASHHYSVTGFDTRDNPARETAEGYSRSFATLPIIFQNGPVAEAGVNGVTQEVLLTVVLDRLRSFQNGEYACKANACAITHIEEALHWLQQRTIERMRRGVEGTSQA